MAFSLSGLQSNQKNTANTQGTRGTAAAAGTGSRVTKEIQSLKPGDTIQGEVLSKNGSEVQIRIDANAIMTARLEKDIRLTLGQNMTFEVKSNSKAQLALRPLLENTAQDANSIRALQAAALPINGKTLFMVSALMEQGMGIDKQTLQSVFKDVLTNQNSNVADVVALHKLQMPVTQENLNQIAGYRNFEHQLVAGIETIAKDLTETLLDMARIENGAPETARLLQNIVQLFAEGAAEHGTNAAGLPEGADGKVIQQSTDGTVLLSETLANGETIEGGLKEWNGALPQESQTGQLAGKEQVLAAESSLKEGMQQPEQALAAADNRDITLLAGRDGEPLLQTADRESLAQQLENIGISSETAAQVRLGTITPSALLTQITQALSWQNVSGEAMKELLSGKGMQQLLKEQIESNWLLTPQKVFSKREVEKMYSRLREQTDRLEQLLSSAGKSESTLSKSVQNVRENVDFMQQLSQNFTYIQLPLKMMTKNAHGDLYVYTNKKNLAKKDGNVSALLHLDLDYLGSMDIYVSMQRERVSTKFYLQKEEMLDFLEANIHILNERLSSRGYQMSTEVIFKEEKANVAAEMLKQEGETNMLSMFSFDVRA